MSTEAVLPDAAEVNEPDMGETSGRPQAVVCETDKASDMAQVSDGEEQDSVSKSPDLTLESHESSESSILNKLHSPIEERDVHGNADDNTTTNARTDPLPMSTDDNPSTGEDVDSGLNLHDSADIDMPTLLDTTDPEVDTHKSVDASNVELVDTEYRTTAESGLVDEKVTASSTTADDTAQSVPVIDSTENKCVDSPPTVSFESTNETQCVDSGTSGQILPDLSQQSTAPEELQCAPALPRADAEAKSETLEDQVPTSGVADDQESTGEVLDDANQGGSVNDSSLLVAESDVGACVAEDQVNESSSSSMDLVMSQQAVPHTDENQAITTSSPAKKCKKADSAVDLTKTKGKMSKKSSSKPAERKTPKKKRKKKESTESTRESSPAATLTAAPPSSASSDQSVAEKLMEQEVHTVASQSAANPVTVHEVDPLRSVQEPYGTQTEQSLTPLLHQAQKLGVVMAGGITGLQPLLKNLLGSFNQPQVAQLEENRLSSLESLHQQLLPAVGECNLPGTSQQLQQQHALLHLSQQCQQLINRLQTKVNQQRESKAVPLDIHSDQGGKQTGSPPPPLLPQPSLLSSNICLPQKRCATETASEESDLMPSSSKKQSIWPQNDVSDERTPSKATSVETLSSVVVGSPVAPPSSALADQSDHNPHPVTQETVAARQSVIRSSSKLVPRSASLPPQLVPSSSLLRQETEGDGLTSSFPLSSSPCLSHTLPPPPLKPTPPTAKAPASLFPVMNSLVPLPSLPSIPRPPDLSSLLVPPQTVGSLPLQSVNTSTVVDSTSVISGSNSPVLIRAGPTAVVSGIGEDVPSVSTCVTSSEHFESVKPISHPSSLSPVPVTGSFHRLEIGSPPAISGQANNIRISLLKPEREHEVVISSASASASDTQTSVDSVHPHTVGSVASGGKFQNFALTPNLSVIATVETQAKILGSPATCSSSLMSFPPIIGEQSSPNAKPHQLKSDSQELQRSLEDHPNSLQGSNINRQCTPEEIEEMSSNLQKRITSILSGSNSVSSTPGYLSQPQLPQPLPLQVPSLLGPVPSLPVPGRGAVSVTVIKSSAQTEPDSLFSNVSVQATTDKTTGTSSPPGNVSGASSNVGSGKLPGLLPLAPVNSTLTQGKPYLPPPVSTASLPSVGIQAASNSTYKKIAPRKPGPSGIVTIQVCNTLPNSSSITAAKMTSQSIGVGTEPSASLTAGVRMTPSILRPRPSAQIGGVLVTPQPSAPMGPASSPIPSTGPGLLRKPMSLGVANSEAQPFPRSPPGRSVFVTKLYPNLTSIATQSKPQVYNPHSRSGLKELSSPAFEEALLSASRLSSKQVQEPEEKEEEKEKHPKKEKKRGGKLKSKEGGKVAGKGKKPKKKIKEERLQADKVLSRLMSEEVLESESDQTSETGSHNGDKNKPSATGSKDEVGGSGEAGEPGEADGDDERGEGGGNKENEEENEDEGSGDADKPPKKNKNNKAGTKKDDMKSLLYSVKLKDCFLHHMLWQDYRVVLLVPLNASGSVKSNSPESKAKSEGTETTTTPDRKRRRKSKIEPLDIHEIEAEMDPLVESPATSSAHIHSPCFSVYELRNKLFSESNAVYAYTYKNQIKTLKPPLHWVHVLKRMGGMQENCHTCRLLDVSNVKGMSQHYGNSSSLPSVLDPLCKNDLPKGRKVIDLSSLDPEDLLESGQLEEIPQCRFLENPPSKKKGLGGTSSKKRHKKQLTQTSTKRPHKDSEHEALDDSFDQSTNLNQSLDQAGPCSQSDQGEEEFGQLHDTQDADDDEEGRLVIAEDVDEESTTSAVNSAQRSPPPLIKHFSPSSGSGKNPQKKKLCPDCGTQIARKCKKCPTCGKRFGVFTFGRKLCPGCGRVNLARMTACYECGHSMQFAQKAIPKGSADDTDTEVKSSAHSRSQFMFGSRKRLRVPEFDGYSHSPDASKSLKLSMADEPSTRLSSTGDPGELHDGDSVIHEGRVRDIDDGTVFDTPAPTGPSGRKSKHLGYQYGRVPWGDADITCLVDENGTPKFCLQELCTKVLRNQVKADVFDMVKNLNLPVLQGDTALLKKLQALGLHSNRSPICRLIAAEELWTLLDALQEPVPVEVHQHLENIGASTSPLVQSPSHVADSGGGPVLQSPGLIAGGPGLIEDDEHGFESTLHEMECSDGQFISILRTWNGEQYACLTEVWRKYFPEVNRNHLTSALKRLGLDTHMPTGQQATLLRSAGVISLRGAAGRLMRLEDTQMLLDDFGIPLQISSSSDSKEKNDAPSSVPPTPPPMKLNSRCLLPQISKRKMSAPGYINSHMVSTVVKQESKEDILYGECMRNILAAVDYNDLVKLLEKSQDEALSCTAGVDEDASAVTADLNGVQQLIHSRRELCNILSSEIGYLTASNHAYMSEVVRLNHSGKQTVQDLESCLLAFNITLH